MFSIVLLYIILGLVVWFPCTVAILKSGFHRWCWSLAIFLLFISILVWPLLIIATLILCIYFRVDERLDGIKGVTNKLDKLCE